MKNRSLMDDFRLYTLICHIQALSRINILVKQSKPPHGGLMYLTSKKSQTFLAGTLKTVRHGSLCLFYSPYSK